MYSETRLANPGGSDFTDLHSTGSPCADLVLALALKGADVVSSVLARLRSRGSLPGHPDRLRSSHRVDQSARAIEFDQTQPSRHRSFQELDTILP